jgi:hypothetical protein
LTLRFEPNLLRAPSLLRCFFNLFIKELYLLLYISGLAPPDRLRKNTNATCDLSSKPTPENIEFLGGPINQGPQRATFRTSGTATEQSSRLARKTDPLPLPRPTLAKSLPIGTLAGCFLILAKSRITVYTFPGPRDPKEGNQTLHLQVCACLLGSWKLEGGAGVCIVGKAGAQLRTRATRSLSLDREGKKISRKLIIPSSPASSRPPSLACPIIQYPASRIQPPASTSSCDIRVSFASHRIAAPC